MANSWESDSCAALKAYYAVYSIPKAAALWCGVPEEHIERIVKEAKPLSHSGLGRSIWTHPTVPCLEPRSRAIAEAIENCSLPHGREDGKTLIFGDFAAHERRHVMGRDLKTWMEKKFPNEKPAFLFDDIEQNTHTSISADSYRALKAERDALKAQLDDGIEAYQSLRREKEEIESERNSLRAAAQNANPLKERSETTYQNIIAVLLDYIAGEIPGIEKHPSFTNDSKLIETIEENFRGYGGLSKSNLSRKLPQARRSLRATV